MRLPSAVSARRGLAVQVNLPVDRTELTGIYLEDDNPISHAQLSRVLKTESREWGLTLQECFFINLFRFNFKVKDVYLNAEH